MDAAVADDGRGAVGADDLGTTTATGATGGEITGDAIGCNSAKDADPPNTTESNTASSNFESSPSKASTSIAARPDLRLCLKNFKKKIQ
jgi:hypothetical protein